MKIATTHELMAALSRSVQQMTESEKAAIRKKLDGRFKPWEVTEKPMHNDLDTLALNDFDRVFLHDLGIAIPEDARWEIDGDASDASDSEAAE